MEKETCQCCGGRQYQPVPGAGGHYGDCNGDAGEGWKPIMRQCPTCLGTGFIEDAEKQKQDELNLLMAEVKWCVEQADAAFADVVKWCRKLAQITGLEERDILWKALHHNALAVGKSNLPAWLAERRGEIRKDIEANGRSRPSKVYP